jgi:hypothetical protein
MRRLVVAVLLPLTFGVAFLACGDSPTDPSGTGGNFRMMLTDGPFTDARAVLITFSDISVHRSGEGGFSSLPLDGGTRTCDLKRLQGAQDLLGVGMLPAGHYTQVRVDVSRAVIYFDSVSTGDACAASIGPPAGRSATVEIPSGTIRLNREFDVPPEGLTTMLLDLDGDRSIHATGNGRYMMNPVISIVSVQ